MLDSIIKYFSSATELAVPEPPVASAPDEPAPIVAHKFDWTALGFPEYKGKFAMVIDNVFTADDCTKLLSAAESASAWNVAALNGEPSKGEGYYDLDYRNSSRIMIDNFELADWILEKVRPYLQDIYFAPGDKFNTFSRKKQRESPTAELSRLNERLRFLKYGPGQFFGPHCDSTYHTPDMTEVSYYTLQLYLNGDPKTLEGGSTRFSTRMKRGQRQSLDVMPRLGRVLVFQQSGLLHSGEEVVSGEKFAMRTEFMYKISPPPKQNGTKELEVVSSSSA